MRIRLLDVDLDLDGALVLGKPIVLHLPDPDLAIEHRAAPIDGAKAIGLERDVQTRQAIRQRRRLGQRLELADQLALGRLDGDVDA
ncbi:hypothetical protein D3C81_1975660 [compost metagenome]